MGKVININTGEMAVDHNDTKITTSGIGSCLVIALYDDQARVGGMAHAMLPSRSRKETSDVVEQARVSITSGELSAKYVDEAVDLLISEIEKNGGKRENIKAKIVGGARMFKVLSGDKFGIGYRNIEAAKKKLITLGINLESEDTGGTIGRMAGLDLSNGILEVNTRM